MLTVYVVSTRTDSTGSFDWFYVEADARSFFATEEAVSAEFRAAPSLGIYEPHYIGPVVVPFTLSADADEITNWLDANPDLWER